VIYWYPFLSKLLHTVANIQSFSVGIITPYLQQKNLFQKKFAKYANVEINTVVSLEFFGYIFFFFLLIWKDGFQGREKDIIFFSCVRTSGITSLHHSFDFANVLATSIGFLEDVRRLNVAITRPKLCLWIVGNSQKLCANSSWQSLITHAKATNACMISFLFHSYLFKSNRCEWFNNEVLIDKYKSCR
jgi:superfamily I DNA and/or RNA helicase